MRTYERPTLMSLGLFQDVTGLGGHGPRDALFQHQLI
ncbi:MAG TPA: keywimysin-related RiPP [Micromonosporaceae bacterium]